MVKAAQKGAKVRNTQRSFSAWGKSLRVWKYWYNWYDQQLLLLNTATGLFSDVLGASCCVLSGTAGIVAQHLLPPHLYTSRRQHAAIATQNWKLSQGPIEQQALGSLCVRVLTPTRAGSSWLQLTIHVAMAQNLLGCSAEQHGRSMLTRNSARNTRFIEISHEFHGVSDLMSLSHLYFCARPVWHKARGGSHLTYFILLTSHDPIFPQLHLSFRARLATIAEAIVCIESQLTAVSTTFSTFACSTKRGLGCGFNIGETFWKTKWCIY